MKLYNFICARVQLKKHHTHPPTIHSSTIHSSTWKLKQKKGTRKCYKKGNTPRKWWFKSNQLIKRIHVLTSFCLASDPQRKNISLACRSIWKRPNLRQPVFRPEVPHAPFTQKRTVREAKFNLKIYTGWNANSYINCNLRVFLLMHLQSPQCWRVFSSFLLIKQSVYVILRL